MRPTRTRSDRACFGIPFPVYRPAHDPEAPLRGAGRYRRTRCGDVTADARRGSVTAGAKLTARGDALGIAATRSPAACPSPCRACNTAAPPKCPRTARLRVSTAGLHKLPLTPTGRTTQRRSEQHPTRLLRRKLEGALPIRTGVNEPTAFLHSPAPANRPSPVTGTGRRPKGDAAPPAASARTSLPKSFASQG